QIIESEGWLDWELRRVDEVNPTTRSHVLLGLEQLAFGRGDFVTATKLACASLALYRELADQRGIASALVTLGTILRDANELDEAQAVLETALPLCQPVGITTASPLFQLGMLFRQKGDLGRARAYLSDALRLAQETRLAEFPAVISYNL